eukprot:COSAG03_NODE_2205_length_3009_cov_5.872340_2_plen_85_part_00
MNEDAAAQARADSMSPVSTSALGAVPRDLDDTMASGSGCTRAAASRQPGCRRQRSVEASEDEGLGIPEAAVQQPLREPAVRSPQ